MVNTDPNSELQNLLHKMRREELTDSEWDMLRTLGANDPFLGDAVEGMQLLSHEERLVRINAIEKSIGNLLRRKNENKRSLPVRLRAIAAVGLLIIGVWAIWQVLPTDDTQLAMQEESTVQELYTDKDADEPGASEDADHAGNPVQEFESSATIESTKDQAIVSGLNEGEKGLAKNEDPPQEQTQSRSGPDLASREAAKPKHNSLSEAPAQRKTGQDLAMKSNEEPKALASATSEADTLQNVIMQPQLDELMPADIPSRSKEMDLTNQKMTQKQKNQGPRQLSYALAVPLGGWQSYYKYIRSQIVIPEAAKEDSIEGTVSLEFDLKEDGTPHNFRIVQSVGYGCDEEAIRLVRAGPKWDVENAQVPIGGLSVDF